MPSFDLTIDDKTYHVEVPAPGARPLQVIVDGEAFEVHVGGESVRSEIPARLVAQPRPAAEALPAPPEPAARPAVPRPEAPTGRSVAGGSSITAPMPGTILSVEVKCGQKVEPGTILCFLEAMKMKNPVRTPTGGTVADIGISAGQTVAYGQFLFQIK